MHRGLHFPTRRTGLPYVFALFGRGIIAGPPFFGSEFYRSTHSLVLAPEWPQKDHERPPCLDNSCVVAVCTVPVQYNVIIYEKGSRNSSTGPFFLQESSDWSKNLAHRVTSITAMASLFGREKNYSEWRHLTTKDFRPIKKVPFKKGYQEGKLRAPFPIYVQLTARTQALVHTLSTTGTSTNMSTGRGAIVKRRGSCFRKLYNSRRRFVFPNLNQLRHYFLSGF